MTLSEKVRLLSGSGSGMSLAAIKRLGIPPIRCSDATLGIVEWGPSTAYPAAPCLTSSWNRKLARLEGRHIGMDARAKHVGILLGPGLNILRQPQNGRSMEYIGGEDPFLAAQMVVPYVQGLQSEDVAACCKHFVGNEIETMRPWINCIISRRALEEIYLPPFRAAVRQGHAWSLMAACNRVNGHYAGANAFNPDYSRSSRQLLHMHGCRCVGGMDAGFLRLWAEGPLTPIGRSGCDGFRQWSERCWNVRRPADRNATRASCRRV